MALPRLAVAKLAFAAAGIALFGAGVRFDDGRIRWAGVAFVAVAWLLRFAGARPGRRDQAAAPDQVPDDTR